MVAQTRAGGHGSPKKLAFTEKILGKGQSTDVVLKKLKTLHTELARLDQELVDVNSLGTARKELINTSILLHKDRGVKAYAACCLADILRLYAPDAPYTQTELRDMFQFFFRQLTAGLKGTDSSYYEQYFHLLESLSTVKSVVLVCDLPNAEELMVDIFRDFFGLVRRDLPKKIEMFMADILVALVDECQALPSDVLDTIMAQFMDKNVGMDQAAYRLAVQVCNATADKLQRHVCQYFTDIIVSHSRDEEFDEIRTAHDLIKQLNRACPSLLHSVIPQLEEELRVDDIQLRVIATQVLGEMFSEKGGSDLVKKYPTTWSFWLLRKNDKASTIRLKFVESAKGLLANLPEHREAIEETLQLKLLDPDEKVRAAVCRVYSQLDYETALHHVSEPQLRLVAGRGLDKKHGVRVEALTSLGKLYSLAYPEIENGDPAAVQQFSWIPNEILNMAVTPEIRVVAEQVISEYIFPLPSVASSSKNTDIDESAWTDRLLNTMKYLDDKAVRLLLTLTGVKGSRPSLYEHYLQICVQYNGGIIDENEEAVTNRLNSISQRIASQFSDPQKASEDIRSFAKINEGRLYKLMKTCMDTQTDLKGLVKASAEFNKRLEQASASIVSTISTILLRGSLHITNQSSIPTLIRRIQKGDGNESSQAEQMANNAKILLTYISKHCPALYKSHVGELVKAIADEKNPRLVEVSLQALAAVVRWDDKLSPNDKRTTERVMRYTLESNHRHAKFAARFLAFSKKKEDVCNQVVDSISEALLDVNSDLLVAHISVLVQIARFAPESFERKSEEVMTFLIRNILMVPSPPESDSMDMDEEWVEEDHVTPTLRAKILSLKVCRHRCIAQPSSDTAEEIAKPVLKMFATLLEYSGSMSADAVDDPKFKSRIRLQAAVSLLHLSTVESYASAITANSMNLAITVQDPCYEVRVTFLNKLVSLLTPRKLHYRFNVIPFLTVHDPEADVKSVAVAYVTYAVRSLPSAVKVEHLEILFIRLLHCIAHHPDFSLSLEQIKGISKYIDFYLDLVATSDNISLLYHLAMKAKTVRDGESEAFSQNLYAASELAQELIRARAQLHSWSLQSYPGKIKLPSDILRALPNPETANKITKTIHLPEDVLSWLAEGSKVAKAAAKTKKRNVERPLRTTGKRKAVPTKANGSAKRSRQAKRWVPGASDEDEESPESSDVDPSSEVDNVPSSAEEDDAEKPSEREEKLGRGARTRAKARIRKQVKKTGKSKAAPSSDD